MGVTSWYVSVFKDVLLNQKIPFVDQFLVTYIEVHLNQKIKVQKLFLWNQAINVNEELNTVLKELAYCWIYQTKKIKKLAQEIPYYKVLF